MNEQKTEFTSRSFLNDITHSYENAWVAARVDAPYSYKDAAPYDVAGQFDLSDGSHTATFFISFETKEQAMKSIESLTIIAKNLEAFIDKLRSSADKLDELNRPGAGAGAEAETVTVMSNFGDLTEGESLHPTKTLQSDV